MFVSLDSPKRLAVEPDRIPGADQASVEHSKPRWNTMHYICILYIDLMCMQCSRIVYKVARFAFPLVEREEAKIRLGGSDTNRFCLRAYSGIAVL